MHSQVNQKLFEQRRRSQEEDPCLHTRAGLRARQPVIKMTGPRAPAMAP